MKTVKYQLPTLYAGYLINDDATGLTDEEHERINEFTQRHHIRALDVNTEEKILAGYNDLDGAIIADCFIYTFEYLPRYHNSRGAKVISTERARGICGNWYENQNCPLYSFFSTGKYDEDKALYYINYVCDEISQYRTRSELGLTVDWRDKTLRKYNLVELNKLKRFFVYKAEEAGKWLKGHSDSAAGYITYYSLYYDKQ